MAGCLFRTILADPPWPYHSQDLKAAPTHRPNTWDGPTGGVAAVTRYDVLSVDEIKALPVSDITDVNAHLYLWTTNSFLVEAHEVAVAWGFEPKTLITWVKHKKGNQAAPSMKMGYWFRSASEHILFAVRGKLRLQDKVCIPTWFSAPRLPHSVKPEESYRLIERASFAPRLELFARRERDGWERWGNEVDSTVAFENRGQEDDRPHVHRPSQEGS